MNLAHEFRRYPREARLLQKSNRQNTEKNQKAIPPIPFLSSLPITACRKTSQHGNQVDNRLESVDTERRPNCIPWDCREPSGYLDTGRSHVKLFLTLWAFSESRRRAGCAGLQKISERQFRLHRRLKGIVAHKLITRTKKLLETYSQARTDRQIRKNVDYIFGIGFFIVCQFFELQNFVVISSNFWSQELRCIFWFQNKRLTSDFKIRLYDHWHFLNSIFNINSVVTADCMDNFFPAPWNRNLGIKQHRRLCLKPSARSFYIFS